MCRLPLSSQSRGKNEAQIILTDLQFSQKSTKSWYNAVYVAILVWGAKHYAVYQLHLYINYLILNMMYS